MGNRSLYVELRVIHHIGGHQGYIEYLSMSVFLESSPISIHSIHVYITVYTHIFVLMCEHKQDVVNEHIQTNKPAMQSSSSEPLSE